MSYEDSVYHYKPDQFKEFIKSIADKSSTVLDALCTFRELKCLPNRFLKITVQEISSNPKPIQELYNVLRAGMQPESRPKLQYNKRVRERELIESLGENFKIDTSRAAAKVLTGSYNDGILAFHYVLEVAIAPRTDIGVTHAGEVQIIGNINDSPSIDGGEGYFRFTNGMYEWTDRKDKLVRSSTLSSILQECGFNTSGYYTSKKKVPCIFFINLKTPVPEWLGAAGKTHINLAPYAADIAKVVSSLAYKMPSYHGKGYVIRYDSYRPKDPDQEGKKYLENFLIERRAAVEADPSLKSKRRITQQGVWYIIHPKMVDNNFQPVNDWGRTRAYLVQSIPKVIRELWPDENITREDLGIIAGARAMMYFDGHEEPVSKDNISRLARTKTTDMIIIEKEGIADALFDYADEYRIALVFTRGRFVNYVKELIQEASDKKINDVNIWVITDYDVDGIEIARAAPNVPRIGVDRNAVRWLQKNGYPNLKLENVEEEHHARDAEIRTDDKYLWNHRIELDSFLAEVGGEGLWKYFMYQMTKPSIRRDYTKIILKPDIESLYPEDISFALIRIKYFTNKFVEDEWKKIKEKLRDIKVELIKPSQKEKFINDRLKEIVECHKEEIRNEFIKEFKAIDSNH
jgi:hypothetical protein